MPNCKHGIESSWCAFCNPKKDSRPIREPQHRSGTTVHGNGIKDVRAAYEAGYVVVSTSRRNKLSEATIDTDARFVHVVGHLFVWAAELMIKKMPHIHTIQVIPKMERTVSERIRQLCAERNIRIVTGHHRPECVWSEGENRSPYYRRQRAFLKGLEGEQRELLQELLCLGFEEAQLVARYFCLKDEPFLSQHDVAIEVDSPSDHDSVISSKINAVLRYLDPTFTAAENVLQTARAIQVRVQRLRSLLAESTSAKEGRDAIAMRLGLELLPEELPLSRIDTFEAVLAAYRLPTFATLQRSHPREFGIVVMRYGLEDGKYTTLQHIGNDLGLTRERIRQLEKEAFLLLGIIDEE